MHLDDLGRQTSRRLTHHQHHSSQCSFTAKWLRPTNLLVFLTRNVRPALCWPRDVEWLVLRICSIKYRILCRLYIAVFRKDSGDWHSLVTWLVSGGYRPDVKLYLSKCTQWRRQLWSTGARPPPRLDFQQFIFSLLWSKLDSQLPKYCVVCEICWYRCQQLTALSISRPTA